jgi:hypothetical protein
MYFLPPKHAPGMKKARNPMGFEDCQEQRAAGLEPM